MENKRKIAVFYVFLAALLFSIGGLCIKLIPWSPLAINGARNLIGVIVVGIFLVVSKHKLVFNLPVAAGAVSMMGVTTFFTIATKLTTAANTIVLQFTAPVFVILLMWLIFKRKPKKLDIITCAIVFGGIIFFFIDGLQAGNMLGNFIAILSGVCYAGVCMMNTAKKADAMSSIFFGQLASAIVFTPFCFSETDFSVQTLTPLIMLGVFQLGLAYVFFSKGIQFTPPVTASLITGIEPVLNPILVAVFYGETISAFSLIGAVIVILAIVVYNIMKTRQSNARIEEN